jgi:hypothetical protein
MGTYWSIGRDGTRAGHDRAQLADTKMPGLTTTVCIFWSLCECFTSFETLELRNSLELKLVVKQC